MKNNKKKTICIDCKTINGDSKIIVICFVIQLAHFVELLIIDVEFFFCSFSEADYFLGLSESYRIRSRNTKKRSFHFVLGQNGDDDDDDCLSSFLFWLTCCYALKILDSRLLLFTRMFLNLFFPLFLFHICYCCPFIMPLYWWWSDWIDLILFFLATDFFLLSI